jgi:hypothetical protein
LEFTFDALSFIASSKMRFRYRLEGYDADWVEAGDRRQAFYTNLKPGKYRFHVIAANADGVWNTAGDQLSLELRPRFSQTPWFYLLARAWMLAVGTGAPCLIVDCAGLAAQGEKNFDRGYRSFLEQAEGSALQVLLSSARRPLRELAAKLTGESNLSFQHFDRLDSAVAHALERAGHLLKRRS